ncbi:phage tail protein [Rhizobium sp. 11515TR]|uniref:phage tail protein n=1 Tax=Rhizobium sp. 11515TR TaxID=2028343 RepID=UPI000BA8C2A5|nr:tail fiber protein [Rhizobium sp. 11515TR]ASW04757.1 hypothetical protein CKA34_01785 [Rhizobium sp. 11515TR]
MAEPFIGEIRQFAFGIVPRGWHVCDGALLDRDKNPALFAIIGYKYGGDGQKQFALPDLRGRTPRSAGKGTPVSTAGGAETVALSSQNMPAHTHSAFSANETGNSAQPALAVPARSSNGAKYYSAGSGDQIALNPSTIQSAGKGAPLTNMQPFLVTNFCIALNGLFPMHQ